MPWSVRVAGFGAPRSWGRGQVVSDDHCSPEESQSLSQHRSSPQSPIAAGSPGRRGQMIAAVLLATGLGFGCTGSDLGDNPALAPSSGVEGVVAAPAESDVAAAPQRPAAERLEAVRVTAADQLAQQLPDAEVAVGSPVVWLRPGDTGERYVVDWQATSAGEVTTGSATMTANSDGTYTIVEFGPASADVENPPVGFVVSVEDVASQPAADAQRDGVASFVADLPLYKRADLGWGAPDYLNAQAGIGQRWILSRYPLEVGRALRDAGALANVDTILAYELLHLEAGTASPARVLRAVPLDVLSPVWVSSGDGKVYAGRKAATSGLNPVLVRIDETAGTVERLIAVFPDRLIADAAQAPAGWTVATPEQAQLMITVAHVEPDFALIDQIFALAP